MAKLLSLIALVALTFSIQATDRSRDYPILDGTASYTLGQGFVSFTVQAKDNRTGASLSFFRKETKTWVKKTVTKTVPWTITFNQDDGVRSHETFAYELRIHTAGVEPLAPTQAFTLSTTMMSYVDAVSVTQTTSSLEATFVDPCTVETNYFWYVRQSAFPFGIIAQGVTPPFNGGSQTVKIPAVVPGSYSIYMCPVGKSDLGVQFIGYSPAFPFTVVPPVNN